MLALFTSILLTSLVGTLLATVLTILKPVTRKVFSAGWHYYMWLCVLIVMVMPVRFHLPERVLQGTPQQEVSITQPQSGITQNPVISVEYTEPEIKSHVPVRTAPVISADIILMLSYIWLAGAIIFFLIKLVSYGIFIKKLHKYSVPIACPELLAYTSRKVSVRISDKICSPLMTGVIKPVLLLPNAELSKGQLGYILAHEVTHLTRNDILYKWFLSIVKCLHWFNPAIYFIAGQVSIDCEISCDMAVTGQMNEKQKKEYIETILALLSKNNKKPMPLSTGMTGSKKTIKRRFIMIKNRIKVSKKAIIISVIVAGIILIASVFASGLLNGAISDKLGSYPVQTDKASGDDFNLLFVGTDNQYRADTIMLIKVKKDSINGISIPRNSLIGDRRIAEIWSSSDGSQALIDAIKQKLNVPIHYFAEVNLKCVAQIVDTLGGMDFNVPMDMVYEDPHQNLKINLKAGYHTLTGEGVCQLLQYRPGHSTQGDLSRIYIAEQFAEQFIMKNLTLENLNKVPKLYKIVSENIKTNLPADKLKKCAHLVSAVKSNNVHFETIDGTCTTYNGMPVYEISNELSFVWPVESKKISQGFGKRVHPITGEVKEHNGVDIQAEENSPVVSAVSGIVSEAGYDTDFGNYIITQNDNGVKVCYHHLANIFVSKGDKVEQNQTIGSVGKTGKATGPHLHFEIQINGEYFNPEKALGDYIAYHDGVDQRDSSAVVTAFFKAFETGDYATMKNYCTNTLINNHFMENDYGNVFNVFGMATAKLRSISKPDYLKGDFFIGYTVNVSCKTPESFSILKSKNTFRVFLEKLEDGTYKIYEFSH